MTKLITKPDPTSTFLSLPPEIRTLIYNYSIPYSRLTPFALINDAEWCIQPNDPDPATTLVRNPPAFIFSNRKIYTEAISIFYSRATLEVAPAQQSNNWFNVRLVGGSGSSGSGKLISHAYARLLSTFRFYNPDHLKLIRQAHIYSNQIDVVDGECYEALLQWLVEHTGVETIQISSRPMTRIRGKAGFDLSEWRAAFVVSDDSDMREFTKDLRVVRVWTKASRPPWEYEKMARLYCSVGNGKLIPMQIYFLSAAAQQLQLDPRWLTRRHDESEKIEMTDKAALLIDALMENVLQGQELLDYKNHSRHFHGENWVYQMIVIAKT